MAKLFLLFLFVPLIEIYFLIELGSVFGAGFTISMVVLTALIGAALVRYQGFATLARAQGEILQNRMPAMEVIEGGLLLLAGTMLLIPGFFTDAIGFLLLVSPLRRLIVQRFLKKRMSGVNQSGHPSAPQTDERRIIDIDHEDLD